MILTNPELGSRMSELEVRARKGCPFAQEAIMQRCLAAAVLDKVARTKHSLTRDEKQRELGISR